MAQFQFNAHAVPPASADGYTPLPLGEHPVVITDSEISPNKNNDGGYIKFAVQVIDGPHKGAVGTWLCNVFSASETAKNIAQRQISSLCHAIGVYQVEDTTQLHGKPFIAVVKPNPTEKNKDNTQIGGIKDIAGNDPSKSRAAAPPAAPAAPAFAAPPAAVPQQAPQTAPQAPAAAGWQQGSTPTTSAPTWANGTPAQAPAAAPAPAWAPSGQPAASAAPPWATQK